MINVTVSGNLVAPPKLVYTGANGEVYGLRFGSSTYKKVGPNFEKHTVWCSGLVAKKKIESIFTRLKKGTYITASSCDGTIREYQANDGSYRAELDLRFCQVVEAGNLPQDPEQAAKRAVQAQHSHAQQVQQAPQHIQPQVNGTYNAQQDPKLQQTIQNYKQQTVPRQQSAQQSNQQNALPFQFDDAIVLLGEL